MRTGHRHSEHAIPAPRRVGLALCCLVAAGALAAGCGGSTGAAAPAGARHATLTKSTTTSTTTTTTTVPANLPACGSRRDPFDPSDSPPPAGSPAIC